MSFLSNLWFSIKDFFTTSDAEAMYNAYKEVVNALETDLPNMEKAVSDLEEMFPVMKDPMAGEEDYFSQGGLVQLYDEKYEIFVKTGDDLIAYYKEYVEAMSEKKREAIRQRDAYKRVVDEENRRKQEMAAAEAAAAAAAASQKGGAFAKKTKG